MASSASSTTPGPAKVFFSDICSSSLVGLAISPYVVCIDRAIMSNASGKQKLWPCFFENMGKLCRQPIQFIRQPIFPPMYFVYFPIYVAANTVETGCVRNGIDPTYPVFASTSITCVLANFYKDTRYTKIFGTIKPRPLPMRSYACYAARDCLAMGGSFAVVPYFANWIAGKGFVSAEKSSVTESEWMRAQLMCPPLMQLLATPVYLLGLDFYNRSEVKCFSERLRFIRSAFLSTYALRVTLAFPAFGIGGLGNRYLRQTFNNV